MVRPFGVRWLDTALAHRTASSRLAKSGVEPPHSEGIIADSACVDPALSGDYNGRVRVITCEDAELENTPGETTEGPVLLSWEMPGWSRRLLFLIPWGLIRGD